MLGRVVVTTGFGDVFGDFGVFGVLGVFGLFADFGVFDDFAFPVLRLLPEFDRTRRLFNRSPSVASTTAWSSTRNRKTFILNSLIWSGVVLKLYTHYS